MAPFMVIDSSIGKWLHFPQFHIEVETDKCISCGKCNRSWSMGVDVKKWFRMGRLQIVRNVLGAVPV